MSGETKDAVSGWTVDTLAEHFAELRRTDRDSLERFFEQRDLRDIERDKRLDERAIAQALGVTTALSAAEKAVLAAMAAAEKAVTKAEVSAQKAADEQSAARDRENADLRSQIDTLRGTRREGVGMSADVFGRLATILIAAVAVAVAVYLGLRHGITLSPVPTVTTP